MTGMRSAQGVVEQADDLVALDGAQGAAETEKSWE